MPILILRNLSLPEGLNFLQQTFVLGDTKLLYLPNGA